MDLGSSRCLPPLSKAPWPARVPLTRLCVWAPLCGRGFPGGSYCLWRTWDSELKLSKRNALGRSEPRVPEAGELGWTPPFLTSLPGDPPVTVRIQRVLSEALSSRGSTRGLGLFQALSVSERCHCSDELTDLPEGRASMTVIPVSCCV